jgi:type III secretion system FlhB-like substrate exporter
MPPKPPRPALIQGAASPRRPRQGAAAPAPPRQALALAGKMLALARERGLTLQEDPGLLEEMARLQASQDIPPELCLLAAQFLSFVRQADQSWDKAQRLGSPDGSGEVLP